MKNTFIFLIVFAAFIMESCENKPVLPTDISCELDTTAILSVHLNHDMVRFHPMSVIENIDGIETLITYNGLYQSNNLQFLNIQHGGATLENIKLPKEGQDAISQVTSFDYYKQDSIFVISMFYVGIINSNGEVLLKQPINRTNINLRGIDFSEKMIFADYNCPLYYDPQENSLYVGIRSSKFDVFHDGFYNGAIAGKLNLTDMSFEEIPIYYPENFKTQRYGTLRTPNITFLEDKIVYNFQYASTIYSYDKKNATIKKFECDSQFTSNQAQPLEMIGFDQEAIQRYSAMNAIFFRMNYDHHKNLWYRTHFSQNFNEHNGMYGKNEAFLSIWNEAFEKIKEIKLPWNINPLGIFITEENLLFYDVATEDEDVASFKKYSLFCE